MATSAKRIDPASLNLKEQVVSINRVTKVVKGGKNLSFSALVVIGDPSAKVVGWGVGKAKEVNLVKENAGKQAWLPALSVGFVARTQDRNVSGLLATPNKSYTNADFYAMASKTITQTKAVPIVLNLGYKATNASVYGLAGDRKSVV